MGIYVYLGEGRVLPTTAPRVIPRLVYPLPVLVLSMVCGILPKSILFIMGLFMFFMGKLSSLTSFAPQEDEKGHGEWRWLLI